MGRHKPMKLMKSSLLIACERVPLFTNDTAAKLFRQILKDEENHLSTFESLIN
jgi:hypothetical protein